MARTYQEFYCNDCDGYFTAKLDDDLTCAVEVVCPNCGRRHPRQLESGRITGNPVGQFAWEIVCMKSSYRKTSRYGVPVGARDAMVIAEPVMPGKDMPA